MFLSNIFFLVLSSRILPSLTLMLTKAAQRTKKETIDERFYWLAASTLLGHRAALSLQQQIKDSKLKVINSNGRRGVTMLEDKETERESRLIVLSCDNPRSFGRFLSLLN